MSAIVQVAVELSLNREFDYCVPEGLTSSVVLGSQVEVPFGRQTRRGYVLAFKDSSEHGELKSVLRVIGDKPLIRETNIRLARWMSDYYLAPLEKCLQTVLPGAVRRRGAGFITRIFIVPANLAQDPRACEELERTSPRGHAVLEIIRAAGEYEQQALLKDVHTTSVLIGKLERAGFVHRETRRLSRDPHRGRHYLPSVPLTLSDEQETARARICEAVGRGTSQVILLHGVTGSGKTEVYLQALAHTLEQGLQAIILVPEISLTPQTVERFRCRFGDRIAVLHSHLSEGERHDEWHRLYDGEARIAIGARSALFAPLQRVGLIVVDEEHEPSYKQSEAPRYHARDVAVMRGHMEGCAVVLGSATPALESWNNARTGKYQLTQLKRRVDDRRMPSMRIIDMRLERSPEGAFRVLSKDLVRAVRERLDAGEQVILFINRRGYAHSLVCKVCGHVAACPDCSISMTYHKFSDELICHLCGRRHGTPALCPNPACRDESFRLPGAGTQRIEELAGQLFGKARITRMDSDTTVHKQAYERILGAFRAGKIDILIGTQMIAKGLHFPNVTLVGVIQADLALHMPDFRAAERCFQLLTQVAGRAGRGEMIGEVLVQTYTPAHPAIQAARRLDFEGFSDQELAFREEAAYPPFARMALITLRGPDETQVVSAAKSLVTHLRKQATPRIALRDPAPAPLARIKTYYRYQIALRAPTHRQLSSLVRHALADYSLPPKIDLVVDVDPQSML